MMRKIAILIAPLLLVVMLEWMFRLGIWEPIATPESHAGTSVRLKRNLLDPSVSKIDFVTLGSSRPEYGIDHERVSAVAREHGYVHANLSMPGVHWMSIGVLTDWLQQHHPEIRGGIIALSAQDLAWPTNGNYELGIVQPFRDASDNAWIAAHIPFDRSNIETWGSHFSLFAWRDDMRDFLSHPFSRLNRFRKSSSQTDTRLLFSNPDMPGDMCNWGLLTLESCEALDADPNGPSNLRQQCRQVMDSVKGRPDFAAMAKQSPLPAFMQQTRDLVQQQLRRIQWPMPPIVLLMPTPPIWRSTVNAEGLQNWALDILKPLQAEGSIRLIDATNFFDADDQGGCPDFGDFYHQNSKGREKFSTWLIDRLHYEQQDARILAPGPRRSR